MEGGTPMKPESKNYRLPIPSHKELRRMRRDLIITMLQADVILQRQIRWILRDDDHWLNG